MSNTTVPVSNTTVPEGNTTVVEVNPTFVFDSDYTFTFSKNSDALPAS